MIDIEYPKWIIEGRARRSVEECKSLCNDMSDEDLIKEELYWGRVAHRLILDREARGNKGRRSDCLKKACNLSALYFGELTRRGKKQ